MIQRTTGLLFALAGATAVWLLPPQQLCAQDSLQVTAVDPANGWILHTGQVVKVTWHYKLTSRDSAVVSIWLRHNGSDGGYRQEGMTGCNATVTNGEGDIVCLISFPIFAAINDSLAMMDKPSGNHLVQQYHNLNYKWTDPRFKDVKPDPVFDTVGEISVNKNFPQAQRLYDLVMSNGAFNSGWFWFDVEPRRWEMTIGTGVCTVAAQKILAAALQCTPDIYNVRINSGPAVGKVQIGALIDASNPPMPTNALYKLAQPEITDQEFLQLVNAWNSSNILRKEEQMRQQALNRSQSSKGMEGLFDAFLSETNTIPRGIPTNKLIACYTFDGNAIDSTGMGKADLNNTKFTQHGLYLNGLYSYNLTADGYTANIPVASLRYEQFTISLSFKPIDFLELTDRPGGHKKRSNIITGGQSTRWFAIRRSDSGNLEINFNNAVGFKHEFAGRPIPLDEWNTISCSFDLPKRSLLVYFDGEKLPGIELPADFRLDVIGSSNHNSDKAFTFANYSNGEVFHGYVSNLIVYDRAFSGDELGKLNRQLDDATGKLETGK